MNKGENKSAVRVIILFVILMVVFTVFIFVYFHRQTMLLSQDNDTGPVYEHHYAYICDDTDSNMYKDIYREAGSSATEIDGYIEYMGKNLTEDYNRNELFKIAVYAGMDGIIFQADESEKTKELINWANEMGTPVITVGRDSASSERKSYVGFGYYDMGQNYGNQILKIDSGEEMDVLILMSPDAANTSQNIIYQGIMDTLNKAAVLDRIKLDTMAISDTSAFGAEEEISSLIMNGELPDIIVCLNEINTTCVCQALVDYNHVGDTQVFGFYTNSTILSSIEKKIITATVTVDTKQMGRYCIDAISEYEKYGYVNEYMPADIVVINSDNVTEYIETDEEGENE